MKDRKSSGIAFPLLDTPLSKRNDDDQEMKIWRPRSFLCGGTHNAHIHIMDHGRTWTDHGRRRRRCPYDQLPDGYNNTPGETHCLFCIRKLSYYSFYRWFFVVSSPTLLH
jgi:hypothetical protein